jgi:hypothetical protein
MTRGVNETFLETSVGEALTGQRSASAANILQAAAEQDIPLVYVDATHLNGLAKVDIPDAALAYVMEAVENGYGVFVPERMVDFEGDLRVAWWQIDLETGEMIGVGEDGTHQFLVILTEEVRFFDRVVKAIKDFIAFIVAQKLRWYVWRGAAVQTWFYFWLQVEAGIAEGGYSQQAYVDAMQATKDYMQSTTWKHDNAWKHFVQRWEENPWVRWIPPEWVK